MIRPQDLSGFRTDFFENLHGLAHIAQWGIFAAVESPRVDSTVSQDDFVVNYPKHFRKWTRVCESNERRCFAPNRAAGAELVAATLRDVTPETLRRVAAEVKARGPFAFDLRKAFWPYWLHALTRHRWRRSRAAASAFSLYPF